MRVVFRHGRNALIALLGGGLLLTMPLAQAAEDFDPAHNAETRALVDELAAQGIERVWLVSAMRGAEFQQGVLDAMSGAVERHLRWDEYRDIFIQPGRIEAGAEFIDKYHDAFARAKADYGVDPAVIAAIIGVETYYGRYTGDHRVIDSLATLAFYHPSRGDFFRGELAAFLEITRKQGVDPLTLEGSYAGAMGYPQFIPTSYRAYAVDFDADGIRDLWHNPVDAIGSVGNYLARHGWVAGGRLVTDARGPQTPPGDIDFNRTQKPYVSVATLAEKGIEPVAGALDANTQVVPLALDVGQGETHYKLGHDNFYVITRYNHSHLYAMAITTLAERIRNAMEDQA